MGIIRMYKKRRRILGMNERNLHYIRPFNKTKAKEIADDKLLTKKVLEKNDIPTTKLIDQIITRNDFSKFDWESLPKSFVMKPVKGLEGGGIEIFYNRDKNGRWIRSDGSKVSVDELKTLALDIMDGKYSLHNQKDSVFFEERVKTHKVFKYYSYKGAPDVRLIVFNNIPIMSYVRLPTKESKGKGNLAQGAIGAAIDLVTGTTTYAIIGKSKPIYFIPGTKLSVSGLKIPYWDKLLRASIQVQRATNLGYAAIDFLIDREKGPVVIEINARPGLSIQLSNRDGLRWRLRKASGIKVDTIGKGVRIAKDLFGGQIEEDIEKISGKQVVSHIEPVNIISKENTKIPTLALIDTSRRTTTINAKLAKKAGIIAEDEIVDETKISDITFELGLDKISTDCRLIPDTIRGYKMLIGRKDLGNYLIDIRKVATGIEYKQRENLLYDQGLNKPENIDNQLSEISKEIFIVRNIRPINRSLERKSFKLQNAYNPQYLYQSIAIDTDRLIEKLNSLNPDTSTKIGKLLRDKIEEMKKEIYLIESIGEDERFPRKSVDLYNEPEEDIFIKAVNIVKETDKIKPAKNSSKILSKNQVEEMIKESLQKIGFDGTLKYTTIGATKAAFSKSKKELIINSNYKFTKEKLIGTIAHEIEIHLARTIAGESKPFKIFTYGTANYIEIEEGLAIWNKSRALQSMQPIRNAALMYISGYMNKKSSFYETYKFLRMLKISDENAYRFTQRTKKGLTDTSKQGAFLKDSLYLKGYLKVREMSNEQIQKLIKNGKTHEYIDPNDLS